MLTPDYLSQFSEPVLKLMEGTQERIVADMARRIAKMGAVSYTTKWQAYKAQELRALRNEITRELSTASKRAEKEIPGLFERAADVALAADDEIYRKAGKPPPTDAHVRALRKTLEAGIRNTMGELRNFTRTIANTTTKQFENALDRAYIDVISGAFSPEYVVRREVKQLAGEGMKVIRYPSGHVDYLDVAIRRAVTTGVNQTCGTLSLQHADEMGCDLVQVSSHIGARPEHAVWQGGIYSRSGKHPKYPDFVSSTGYGSGAGLCGWNCHHHFYPFFEGLSADAYARYDPKENEARYVQTQTQREYERRIRKSKRELAALDSAIKAAPNGATRDALQADFTRAASMLKRRETALREFLRNTPLPRRQYREQVGEFGRSQSGKAVWAARKALKKTGKGGILLAGRDVKLQNVNTGGRRNEKPLTLTQQQEVKDYALLLGMTSEQIRYGEHYNTAYGSNFDILYIGTDVYPYSKKTNNPNSKITWKAAIAHEIVGHRETVMKGWESDNQALDEAQASIRAARFAPDLTRAERYILLRDGLFRLRSEKLKLSAVRNKLYIQER